MRRASITALVIAALAVTGCNAVKGAGRDIQSVGQAGQDAINSAKN